MNWSASWPKLLRAERRARGTRKGTRLLTCFRQALLVLVWMRTKGEVEVIGAGFGVPRATAYRYRDEALTVLAAQAPDLHEALQEVAEQGWSHVVLDGKLIRTDRCAETTTSVKGETINAWYSGKHRAPGGNVQAVIRPDGHADRGLAGRARAPARPDRGPRHRRHRRAELGGVAARPAHVADSGYDGAGQGIKTPIKQPADGQVLAPDNQAYNTLLRSTPLWKPLTSMTRTFRIGRRSTPRPSGLSLVGCRRTDRGWLRSPSIRRGPRRPY